MFNFFKKAKPPQEKLWQHFKGRRNTQDVLVEKAKFAAPIVVHMVAEDTKMLFQLLKEHENMNIDEKFGTVFFEMAFFYLHFVDRIAFQYLKVEEKKIFVDAFFIEVKERMLSRVHESGIDAAGVQSIFDETYNERQREYGQYKKLYAERDEGQAGALFWEFGRIIAGVLGLEMNIVPILLAQRIGSYLTGLQLPDLFKE